MGRQVSNSATSPRVSKTNSEEQSTTMGIAMGDSQRLVILHGEVNEASISLVVAQLLHLACQNHKPIHLVISTYGGSVD